MTCEKTAVAVIGLGCRLPGANTPAEFWKLLCEGVDAISEIPADRSHYRQPGGFGRLISQRGGFVEHLQDFDPYFFGMSPREAAGFDPQQRFLFEAAWRASEDAGITAAQLQRSLTGVFVGLCTDDYHDILQQETPEAEMQMVFSNLRANGSGRLSYALGLNGPSVTVDTACSSSLVCVHLAVRSIQAGDCELAFAGGANSLLNPAVTRAFMRGGLLSPDGKCQSFSNNANGFVRSEGAGMVLLKPLARALEDGDRIYAVIRGSAVNNDGGSSPFMTPSQQGQVRVIRAACAEAEVSPADLAYVEAHGTGTPTGDPIEVSALAEAMEASSSTLRIGSCKTNIGHLEGAAGVAGLMKVALSVYHGVIPPSIHAGELSSTIAWDDVPMSVQQSLTAWPEGKQRLAGVSSFGISGTNAHVVLAAAPIEQQAGAVEGDRTHLLPISARDEHSLKELVGAWKQHLFQSSSSLADLCHSASLRRTHFDYRLVASGRTREQLADALSAWDAGQTGPGLVSGRASREPPNRPVFVFSGIGSQWPGMALELYSRYPVFRDSLERAESAIAKLAGWSVIEELRRDDASCRLDRVEFMQPSLFALQIGLAALWKSWGVEPGVVIGHSLGEIAAANCAGALSLEDAALVVVARSQLMASIGKPGGMLACGLTPAEGEALIRGYEDRVAVGVISGRRSIVLSGERTAIEEIGRKLEGTDVFCRRVRSDVATHSPLMDGVLAEYERRISAIEPHTSNLPLYSTVTGEPIAGSALTPSYWVRNLRGSVIFGPAMERMLQEGERLFIEISAHPLLVMPMQQTAGERSCSCTFISSLRRKQDSEATMLEAFSQLHVAGYPVNWAAHSGPGAKLTDVPGHPFRRERVWFDHDSNVRHAEQTFARTARPGAHPLLPLRFNLADKPGVHVWQGTLDPTDHPFLTQHLSQSQPVLPAAVYYEMAYAISCEVFGGGPKTFRNIQLRKALFPSEGQTLLLQAVLAPSRANSFSIRFYSAKNQESEWELCCEMTLHEGSTEIPQAPVRREDRNQFPRRITSQEFYGLTKSCGLEYGPLYQGVHEAWNRGGEAIADLRMPERLKDEIGFQLHPAFLDALLQLPLLPMALSGSAKAMVPAAVEEIHFAQALDPGEPYWGYCRVYEPLNFDAALIREDGAVVFWLRLATCRELEAASANNTDQAWRSWTYQKYWEEGAVPEYSASSSRWLIVGDAPDLNLLGRQLELQGQSWKSLPLPKGPVDSKLEAFAALKAPPWRGIIYLAAPEHDKADIGLASAQKESCGGLLELIQSASRVLAATPVRIFVVTKGANAIAPGDQCRVFLGPVLGLARAAGSEFPPFQITTVDLDATQPGFGQLVPELLACSPEWEVAYRRGTRYVARIDRLQVDRLGRRRKHVRLNSERATSYKVVSSNPGSIDSLALELASRRTPQAGEIEVRVGAAGLNFLDVLRSLNMGPGQTPGAASFGMELSGRVTRVGDGVTAFRPGDPVMALADFREGCLQAYVTIPTRFAWPVPSNFTLEQAAGCLVAYQTAWYALMELGRMRAGDKVLIHAAAGGVGLAAIHVAQHIGAEIFATAGSPEKRDYLRKLGVQHVMDSRTLEFSDQVLADTGGRGVDLVLNSISGEAIPKSLATLAMGGRFLEIGKRDVYANSAIELLPFRRNLSFHAIDMLGLIAEQPDMVLRVTNEVVDRLVRGDLPPLALSAFPASLAQDAFRFMVQSRQIGKVIVTFEETEVDAEIPEDKIIRDDASYLITGGLTGLGLECARWLADRGARHIVLAGRRKPTAAETEMVDQIRQGGVGVITTIQDVSDREGVRRLIEAIDKDMPPLAGVIHSAGIARDGILERLRWSQFEEVFASKLEGGWNLHAELRDRDLDFFIMFSSVASLLGSAGQANYAAANAFLDSLGEHRRCVGVPSLTINWGPWTGIGMLVRHKLEPSPMFGAGIQAAQGIACLDALLAKDCAHATVMSADWKIWGQSASGPSARPLFANLRHEMTGADSAGQPLAETIGSELAGVSKAEGVGLIRARLTKEVVRVLRVAEDRLDPHTGLQAFGLDSLVAVELSNRIQRSLGINVPVMTLLKGSSLDELATSLYDRVALSPDAANGGHSNGSAGFAAGLDPLTVSRSEARISKIRPDTWVIQEHGSQPALFCLGGGQHWVFIAQQLGDDQPVIGILPTSLHVSGNPSIGDFAASIVKAIREQQPAGPYRLAGWSVWGLIAFEAAQQIAESGEEVQLVAIVDTFLPLASRKLTRAKRLTAWARLEQKSLLHHIGKLRNGETLTVDYVRQRLDSLVRFRIRPVIDAAFAAEKPVGDIHSSKELSELVLAASIKYRTRPYAGRVLLCAAADRPSGPEWDYVSAWKEVLVGDVEVAVVEGNHVTMFDPENVQPLVEKLRVLLEPAPK